jgi:hypothetical protein
LASYIADSNTWQRRDRSLSSFVVWLNAGYQLLLIFFSFLHHPTWQKLETDSSHEHATRRMLSGLYSLFTPTVWWEEIDETPKVSNEIELVH